jgi:hypothetical protein
MNKVGRPGVDLVQIDPIVRLPDGYQWVDGKFGGGRSGLFLVPKRKLRFKEERVEDDIKTELSSRGKKVQVFVSEPVPSRFLHSEVYLEFRQLEPVQPKILAFANRYGPLGIEKHFHRGDSIQWGEAESDWRSETQQFQECFEIWELTQGAKEEELRRWLRSQFWLKDRFLRPQLRREPRLLATHGLVARVNEKLSGPLGRPEKCTFCSMAAPLHRARPLVTYEFYVETQTDTSGREGARTPEIRQRVRAATLLAGIWLQFAEMISGQRTLRLCEKCGKWMDITQCQRKGAKRMHDKCSRRERMAKYRATKREIDL